MTCKKTIGQHITLADGRRLGFAEFGDPRGKPVFYFHGFPGSRLEAKLAESIALDSHVRFIGIDRPGCGLSSFKPARTFVDWADDVIALADAVGIICGMGPVDVPDLIRGMPWLYRQSLRIAGRCRESPSSYMLFLHSFSD